MTPEHPASGWTNQPVDLPDLRSLGVHQPVILVADDEALIRNLVTLLLQHVGYFVLSAADGHEVLELSRKYPGPIDLVITDVQMPRLNGTDRVWLSYWTVKPRGQTYVAGEVSVRLQVPIDH